MHLAVELGRQSGAANKVDYPLLSSLRVHVELVRQHAQVDALRPKEINWKTIGIDTGRWLYPLHACITPSTLPSVSRKDIIKHCQVSAEHSVSYTLACAPQTHILHAGKHVSFTRRFNCETL